MTSQSLGPRDAAGAAHAFLVRHDEHLQPRAAVLGHAYGAPGHDVFLLTRAAMVDRWPELGNATEHVRTVELDLLLARTARSLGGHATPPGHRPRPAVPPTPRSVLLARGLEPGWRRPDPWRLLAAPAARPLRALVHLDPLARDLAVLRWLEVPHPDAAAELGLPGAGLAARLDDAMRQWAAVVEAAEQGHGTGGPGPGR
ncbi:hypothetical protein [Actinomycetospora atypica]|uniref:Uncharacterized protein n=1 Tax=Actinomycetospora atypica TaxID=1290095 RepID=A0ABV9YRE8_9PSEU